MSIQKTISGIALSAIFLTLVSCGNKDHSSSNTKSINPVCSELDCLSSITWKIELPGKSFPSKSRIDINGTTVLNECVSKQKYAIDREEEPQNIVLENFYVPKKGQLKIDVVDLGHDCESESSFLSESDVQFEVTKGLEANELLIRL